MGKPPALEVGLLGAPETSMAGYCPRVLEGITLPGAVRSSLDASLGGGGRGGSRTVLAKTGPAREHNQRAWTLVTETVGDEREVI